MCGTAKGKYCEKFPRLERKRRKVYAAFVSSTKLKGGVLPSLLLWPNEVNSSCCICSHSYSTIRYSLCAMVARVSLHSLNPYIPSWLPPGFKWATGRGAASQPAANLWAKPGLAKDLAVASAQNSIRHPSKGLTPAYAARKEKKKTRLERGEKAMRSLLLPHTRGQLQDTAGEQQWQPNWRRAAVRVLRLVHDCRSASPLSIILYIPRRLSGHVYRNLYTRI